MEREDTFEEAREARAYTRKIMDEAEEILERCKYATERAQNKKWNSRLPDYFKTIRHLASKAEKEVKEKERVRV
jgi:hypothetical protein